MLEMLIKRRKSLGMSQTALSNLCGCSQNTISAIENGTYMPRLTLAYKICWVLCYEQYEITPNPDDFISHDQLMLITFRAFFGDYISIAKIQLDSCLDNVLEVWNEKNKR